MNGLFRTRAVRIVAVLVGLALFLFIKKFLGWMMKLRREEVAATPPLTKDQELLTEIRDLLKDGRLQSGTAAARPPAPA